MIAAPIDTPALWLGAVTALAVVGFLVAALLIVVATQAAAYRIRCHLADRRHHAYGFGRCLTCGVEHGAPHEHAFHQEPDE